MDITLVALIGFLALVLLDLAALRFGHDSRRPRDARREWW